jgi:hypothetical protein
LRFYLAFYPFDFYASNLSIPENIKIHTPKDSITKVWDPNDKFEIYNDVQPGIYSYETAFNTIEQGTIYLKAYEVTKNDQLSAERILMRTSLEVENTSDTLRRYHSKESFTIYEGDWGDHYAARFELWFKPENGNERKITEKIYKVQGWQR